MLPRSFPPFLPLPRGFFPGCSGVTSSLFVPAQLFTDGITNKLVACYTDEGMADAVLVRVYGRRTELLVDRETELRNFQVLRAHGCAPDLYCAFQNGLCYQFLPGIALGPDHVRDPHIFRCVGTPVWSPGGGFPGVCSVFPALPSLPWVGVTGVPSPGWCWGIKGPKFQPGSSELANF